jgi:hypothetical protein
VDADLSSLPDDLEALKAALIAARTEAAAEKACAVAAVAELAQGRALIAHLNLEIEKLRRTIYGPRSERTVSFGAGSECRSARQTIEMIDWGGVNSSRPFTL